MLAALLVVAGCGGGSSSTRTQTAAPTFSPGGGTYTSSQTVTIADTTKGAVLYCTTDGTTPTTASPQCAEPTTVYQTGFLQAIAVAPGMSASPVVSAGYTIDLNAAATPTFSPSGGTYSIPQTVTISDAISGANLYYTTDGSTPTASSMLYAAPITVAESETLNAIAVASGYGNSPVASAAYVIGSLPAISILSPSSATAGGAAFTLTLGGFNFTSDAVVDWNGSPLTTTFVSPTQLTASAPASLIAAAGTAAVTVVEAAGTSAGALFTINSAAPAAAPTIASLSPSSGPIGTSVTITGTNFGATQASSTVSFNGTTATSITSWSNTSIVAVVPSGATSGNVVVTVGDAASNGESFTVGAVAPTITGLSPASAVVGASVTITGTNFGAAQGSSTVSFSGTAASVSSWSNTSIVAIVPSGAASGNVVVTVDGTASNGESFTVNAASTPQTIAGTVVGGNSPVAGATVQLYAAGQSGYGARATVLASAAAATSSTGAFTVTYNSCPSAPGDQLYLVATTSGGGNTNPSIALMTALGSCSALPVSETVVMNEVTTIASAYALSAFATVNTSGGGISVGAPALSSDNYCNAAGNWQSSGPETCGYLGLSNAFKTVRNLVNVDNASDVVPMGEARSYTPAYTQSLSADTYVVNNSTVPQARIHTLANILAACVEDTSADNFSNCSTLFTDAMAFDGSTSPTDTLQAALNIALNPGLSQPGTLSTGNSAAMSSLFGLQSSFSAPPYSATTDTTYNPNGYLTAAPTDWTLALTYTGGGLGLWTNLPGSASATVPGYPSPETAIGPSANTSLAIDATGNVWVSAFGENAMSNVGEIYWPAGSGGLGYEFAPMLVEFNNQGAPQTPATSYNSSAGTVTYGGLQLATSPLYEPQTTPGGQPISSPVSETDALEYEDIAADLAIDPSGNVWAASGLYIGDLLVYAPAGVSGSNLGGFYQAFNSGAYGGAFLLAVDGSGTVWATLNSDEQLPLVEGYTANSTASSLPTQLTASYETPSSLNSSYVSKSSSFTIDSNSNVWFLGSNDTNSTVNLYPLNTATGVLGSTPAFSSTNYNQFYDPTLVSDGSGNVYSCLDSGSDLDVFSDASGTPTWVNQSSSYVLQNGAGTTWGTRGCGSQLVLDGQGHLFAITNISFDTPTSYVDEFTTAGIAISPLANGYTGTSGSEAFTIQSDLNFTGGSSTPGLSAAIDGSGNLWVLNVDTSGTTPAYGTTTTPGNVLVEYIGIGAPVVTPTSVALQNGTLGVRP